MASKKEPLDTLGLLRVNNNAQPTAQEIQEIDKAFRTAALATHPDRQIGKSEEEKQKAEVVFKKATEAKDALLQKPTAKQQTLLIKDAPAKKKPQLTEANPTAPRNVSYTKFKENPMSFRVESDKFANSTTLGQVAKGDPKSAFSASFEKLKENASFRRLFAKLEENIRPFHPAEKQLNKEEKAIVKALHNWLTFSCSGSAKDISESVFRLKDQLSDALLSYKDRDTGYNVFDPETVKEMLNSPAVLNPFTEKLSQHFLAQKEMTLAEQRAATISVIETYASDVRYAKHDPRVSAEKYSILDDIKLKAEAVFYSQAIASNNGKPVFEVRLSDEPDPLKQTYVVTEHKLTKKNQRVEILDVTIPDTEKKYVKEAMGRLIENIWPEKKPEPLDLNKAYIESKTDLGFAKNQAQAENLLTAKYSEVLATEKYETEKSKNPKPENLITLQLEALKAKLEYHAVLYDIRIENKQERTSGNSILPSVFHGSDEKTAAQKLNATEEMVSGQAPINFLKKS